MSTPDRCGWCDRPPDPECQRQPCWRTDRAGTLCRCKGDCGGWITEGQLQVLTTAGRMHLWCEEKWVRAVPSGV